MRNKMKKLLCSLLATVMLVSSAGMSAIVASAADTDTAANVVASDASTADQTDEEKEAVEEAEPTPIPVEDVDPISSYDLDTYYQKALTLCSSLGIISGYEDGSIKPESKVTRAEMASIVLRLLAMNTASKYQDIFTDVSSSHWAADQIQSAYEGSIVSGMGDGTFQPDGDVTYAQVVVMLVNALNYQQDAENLGGWQQGYMTKAKDLDLLKNAPGSNDVASDRGTVIKMIYNTLLADYRELRTFDKNGSPKYEVNADHPSLAYAKFELIDEKGILIGTEKTTIGTTDLQEGQIELRADKATTSAVYDTALTGLEDYIAQKVTYYYKENAGRTAVVYAVTYDAAKSETYEIADPDDIDYIEGFEDNLGAIKVQGVSKVKDCKNATIVYNGKVLTSGQLEEIGDGINDMLKPEVGSLKLVKSEKSNENYDVIFVDSYETVIISSVGSDRLTGKVSAGDPDDIGATVGYTLDLDDKEDRVITVSRLGEEAKLKNLKKDDVASIKRSYAPNTGGTNGVTYSPVNVDIVVTGDSITGSATSITKKFDESHATVNGEKYDVANIAVDDLKTGSQSTFYLDKFGRIGRIDSVAGGQLQSGEKYGWIMSAYDSESGDDYLIQLMTTDGNAIEYKVANSLDFWAPTAITNVTLKGTDAEEAIDVLVKGDAFLKGSKTNTPIRVVKYKTNSSNELTRLYCAVDKNEVSDKSALRVDKTDLKDVAIVGGLVGGYKIEDGILEMSVPKNAADMKDSGNYKFGEVNSSSYVVRENGSSRNYIVAEFDDSTPSLLIQFTASSDALANLGDIDTNANNPVMVVEDIDIGVDDEDNQVFTVNGYVNGTEASFTTTKNTVLGKLSTTSAIINSARDYLTTALWDAKNGAADGSERAFTQIVEKGDLILYDGGERLIQLLDADDVYNVVVNGADKKGLLFGAFDPFNARNMFAFGALLDSKLDANAQITIDAKSNYITGTVDFDPAKLMDTVEININSGKASIDTEGSEISDLINYDETTKTGDYAFMRLCDKGTLQEIVVYRFVK